MGALVVLLVYRAELRRMAQFLETHERSNNARITLSSALPGLPELTDALNNELAATAQARISEHTQAADFRRGLSALSHDIRTPLMGAQGYVQLAAEEQELAQRQQFLGTARQRLEDTESLLDQLFSYTQATDPDLEMTIESVALQPLLADIFIGHYPEFEQRSWEPVLTYDDEGASVAADADHLRRIVENLVTNTIRYGYAAPHLAVRQSDKTVELILSNDVAHPEALDVNRLFERFYQADGARGSSGVGLGLAVAHTLAIAMGMELTASYEHNVLSMHLHMSRANKNAVSHQGHRIGDSSL